MHALLDRVPDDEPVDDGLPLLPDAVDAPDGLDVDGKATSINYF